jgi:hypothetical protein
VNVDLLGTIRLLHRVLGFLAQQPAERLLDIADGRRQLLLSDLAAPSEPAGPSAAPAPEPVRRSALEPRGSSHVRTRPVGKAVGTNAEDAEVVAKLRSLSDVDEGIAYLAALRPGKKRLKADLLRWCAAADLEISPKASNADLERKLLEHTIAAKKKYAGLSRW